MSPKAVSQSDRSAYRVLVVDDEEHTAAGLCELIQRWGYQCRSASGVAAALEMCGAYTPHIFLSDLMMPGQDGMEFMRIVREKYPNAEFILLTGHGTIENAIEAMREGAYDYLTKPYNLEKLRVVLERVVERVSDREEMHRLTWDLAEQGRFGRLIGRAPVMQDIYRVLGQAAPSTASVLITGESGTGKEVVARTLHDKSHRRNRPFVAVNCAAIPHSLLESEIFGHERGSFTGATNAREGCFEQAHTGTLLLDEIGEMTPELQAKLLRVLEERVVRRVGGKQEIPVDVRLISSTNVNVERAIAEGKFREDLFYRLNVLTVHLPPLRERREDIPLLARHFLADLTKAGGNSTLRDFTPAALGVLQAHAWPGNVRELRNVVERATIVAAGPAVDIGDLQGLGRAGTDSATPAVATPGSQPGDEPSALNVTVSVGTTVEEAERKLIEETLKSTRDNKTRAAEILGISTKTLHNKLKKYLRDRDR